MYRPTLIVLAVVVAVFSQRPFIEKCSLSSPDLEQCFVKSANRALEVIVKDGVEDLGIPSLNGYSIDVTHIRDSTNLYVLLEKAKAYPVQPAITNVTLTFTLDKNLHSAVLYFEMSDLYLTADYRALVFLGDLAEQRGKTRINFGKIEGHYDVDFQRKVFGEMSYFQVANYNGSFSSNSDNFEFIREEITLSKGEIADEHFQHLYQSAIEKAQEICFGLATFAINEIWSEIPENELFLP